MNTKVSVFTSQALIFLPFDQFFDFSLWQKKQLLSKNETAKKRKP
jgi:hypothetical protein